jgi:hypothetical protein
MSGIIQDVVSKGKLLYESDHSSVNGKGGRRLSNGAAGASRATRDMAKKAAKICRQIRGIIRQSLGLRS